MPADSKVQTRFTCHEGERAERAAELMRSLGAAVLWVENDCDRVTGRLTEEELISCLRASNAATVRLRDVINRPV